MNCLHCNIELPKGKKVFCGRVCAGKHVGNLPKGQRLISDETYIQDIVVVKNQIGRYPTYGEYKELGKYSIGSIQDRFQSWAKALQLAGYQNPFSGWKIDDVLPEDGAWLSGFFAGEGAFIITKASAKYERYDASISISQRNDNHKPILEIIRILGLNPYICHLHTSGKGKKKNSLYISNPTLCLTIRRSTVLKERVIPLFKRFKFHSVKDDELLIFEKAVNVIYNHLANGRFHLPYYIEESTELHNAFIEIRAIRKYKKPQHIIEFTRIDRMKPFIYHLG